MRTGGGILMIGIGVALISLAYTGRAQAVWTALTQDQAGAIPPDTEPQSQQPPIQQAGAVPNLPLDGVPVYRMTPGGLRHG